jgi:hypothetical protein
MGGRSTNTHKQHGYNGDSFIISRVRGRKIMSLITDLPAIFDQFSDARQKGFLTVMDLKEQNVPLVGTYCTFMPQEIAMAAGAVVVSLCSTSDETIEEAEKDLPRNLCPLIKSSYGFGKTDKCPYFYFSDLVVGETTCDGKKDVRIHGRVQAGARDAATEQRQRRRLPGAVESGDQAPAAGD